MRSLEYKRYCHKTKEKVQEICLAGNHIYINYVFIFLGLNRIITLN